MVSGYTFFLFASQHISTLIVWFHTVLHYRKKFLEVDHLKLKYLIWDLLLICKKLAKERAGFSCGKS